MENLNVFITRIAIAALTSALFCAAAVFFVVDISLRGVETAIIATNERFDDVSGRLNDMSSRFNSVDARFDSIETRFDTLERSVDRSTDLLREEMRAGFASIAGVESGSIVQDRNIEITASTLARLSTMLMLQVREAASPEELKRLSDLRVGITILCRDVLGRDHPDCAQFP